MQNDYCRLSVSIENGSLEEFFSALTTCAIKYTRHSEVISRTYDDSNSEELTIYGRLNGGVGYELSKFKSTIKFEVDTIELAEAEQMKKALAGKVSDSAITITNYSKHNFRAGILALMTTLSFVGLAIYGLISLILKFV